MTGKVSGFVYSGIAFGSMFMPVIFGWMLDQPQPRGVFLVMVIALVMTLATVLTLPTRQSKTSDATPKQNLRAERLTTLLREAQEKLT